MNITANRKHVVTVAFLFALLCLYLAGFAIMQGTSTAVYRDFLASYAYPIDCMVILPALFYVFIIRRNNLSPLFVIPVMWFGGVLATFFSQGADLTLVLSLSAAALAVEASIAVREIVRFVKKFIEAKKVSDNPSSWFFAPLMQMTGNRRVSILAAKEFSTLYYTFFSWKHPKPTSLPERVFSYHKDSGYTSFIVGMILVIPIEMVVMHLLVSQWNDVAAWLLTIASLYAVIWVVADCRASILRPIILTDDTLEINSGMRFSASIPLVLISSYQKEMPDVDKSKTLNLGMMGDVSGWLLFDKPVEVETFLGGTKEVEAIGITVDDRPRFAREIGDILKST